MVTTPRTSSAPAFAAEATPYCQVIAQARYAGEQELSVMGVAHGGSATGRPYISVRVGRVLLYLEDRAALVSWTEAWRRTLDLADGVFGPACDSFSEIEAAERRHFERTTKR